jgi:hypothetical protein
MHYIFSLDLTHFNEFVSFVLKYVVSLHFKHIFFDFSIVRWLLLSIFLLSEDESFSISGVDRLAREDFLNVGEKLGDLFILGIFSHIKQNVGVLFGDLAFLHFHSTLVIVLKPFL